MNSYQLSGNAIGACGCDSAISCLCSNATDPQAPANGCSSLLCYHIVQGVINNTDVSGAVVARIIRGNEEFIYLDSSLDSSAQLLLIQAFNGDLGGILQQLSQLSQASKTIRISPINFQYQRDRVTLMIGGHTIKKNIRSTKFCFTQQ